MRVALVHDWLTTMGGAEKVLETLTETFPAKLFTLVQDPKKLEGTPFEEMDVKTSFIQKLPRAKSKYRSYLPLFPMAIEQFDLSDYDLVISSSHSIAKGVLTHADQLHICYCHTPMRYAWDLYQQYLREAKLKSGLKGVFAKFFLHYLRMWDAHCSSRVDTYVANSEYVARRIQKLYEKEAMVIYPPVDVDYFSLFEEKEDFYLTASRMVPYKKIDLIVEAFGEMPDKKLVVIGDGPEMDKVKAKAKGNVEVLGYQEDSVLRSYLQRAKGFVFAALEDFGILPVEAQGCGTPVIAFGKGGACETVVENETGLFFEEQSVPSLIKAIKAFEKREFDPKKIRAHSEKFRSEIFKAKFQALVAATVEGAR
ncbi:glycosyltransferase family 4 protein [Candidatus Neptunichlamydia sp. REUL1]|uniref:glycosyltransferase family 4 protein n=1 Tax=Candidatus Neptunichlamydia sp. REUL1 TaxID=3064277 RepID=UPI00292F3070|nr:glycosyltransferase family 4 protein [Candidatus Neptunochlamydia sp. REUL1]